jgi:hypothetical protein
MAKEFTDYVLMVLGMGERVYDLEHARQIKGRLYFDHPEKITVRKMKQPSDDRTRNVNGHQYLLNLDRAYRVNWTPWKKLVVEKPYWRNFCHPIIELIRSKKVGLLIYQERIQELGPPVVREEKIPIGWACPACDFKRKERKGVKRHITVKHKGENLEPKEECQVNTITTPTLLPIPPMHISRIHQPSGVMKG